MFLTLKKKVYEFIGIVVKKIKYLTYTIRSLCLVYVIINCWLDIRFIYVILFFWLFIELLFGIFKRYFYAKFILKIKKNKNNITKYKKYINIFLFLNMIFLCYIIYVMLIDIFKLVYYFYLEFLKFNKIIELNNVNYFNDNNYNIKQPSLFSIGIISYYGIRGIFNIFKNNIFVTASFFSIIKFSLIYYSYVFGGYANKVIKNFIKKIYEDNKGSDNNSENSNGGNTKRDAKVEADINKSSDSNQEINNKFNDDLALNNYNLDTINNEVDLNNNGEIFNNLLYSLNTEGLGHSNIEVIINNMYILELCKILFLYLIYSILINRFILKWLDNSGIIYKININWFKNHMIKHINKMLIINIKFFNFIIKLSIITIIGISIMELFGIFGINFDIRIIIINYLKTINSGKIHLTIINMDQYSVLENSIHTIFYINLLIIFLIFISLILYRNVKNIDTNIKRWIILYILIFLINIIFIFNHIYIKDLMDNLNKYILDYMDLHIIVNSLFIFNNKYKIKELNKRIKKFIYIKIKLIYCTYKFIYSKINDLFYNFKNKSKYCFILPFIIKTLEKEIPAEADHIISFSFNILILLIIVLLSFINIIGYFLSIYLINKYDIETKFPKFSWIIRKYEQSNLIFVSIEIFIALTFLIIAIIGHLWFIGIFVF